ncbi:hypothetical protein G9A89_022862 [Geosiphon pyriformis]|nr:hypothetical protein G9A89_022862 [Geosiphon pyriformis]
MNILPHKSYHVYNIKNREKVRKDEEKAKLQEEAKSERALTAEREHRLSLLRQRAQQRQECPKTSLTGGSPVLSPTLGFIVTENDKQTLEVRSKMAIEESKSGHINFWAELEENNLKNAVSTNPEYEAEKKAKEDKWERKITMYLDDVSKDLKPWYGTLSVDSKKLNEEKEKWIKNKEDKSKLRNDPLTTMSRYLDKKAQKKEKKIVNSSHNTNMKETSVISAHPDNTGKSIELLRRERIEREREERLRVQKLLNPNLRVEERKGYNSQYNPDATNAAHHLHGRRGSDRHYDHRRSNRYQPNPY